MNIEEKHDFFDYFFSILLAICVLLSVFMICETTWHNSEVDAQNKELEFCKSIYDSDHVVLEQCKDYFVIVERSEE